METQEFMGSGQLVDRLTAQVRDRGFAMALLKKRGDMAADGSLTAKGEEANAMNSGQRATKRASEKSGKPEYLYTYNPLTNTSTLA
jgi:hypothetical protein